MATMWQAGTEMRNFAQEFEWHAQDAGMTEEDTKVHLVSVLNQDTLSYLDTYTTMQGGIEMAHLKTVQDGLCQVLYVHMLVNLK